MDSRVFRLLSHMIRMGMILVAGLMHNEFCRKGEQKLKWMTRIIMALVILQAVLTAFETC